MLDFYHGVETVEIDTGARPIRTVKSGVIGIIGTAPEADAAKFPLNKPVLMIGRTNLSGALGATGTLPSALEAIFDQVGATVVIVRVEEGADDAATLANVLGGDDPQTGEFTGCLAFRAAENLLGVRPKILLAPGFSHEVSVVNKLSTVAEILRAVVLADSGFTTPAEAVVHRDLFGSKRVYMLYQRVIVTRAGVTQPEPMSSVVAGLMAKIDQERGWWWSPSNQVLKIDGVETPTDYARSGRDSTANYLNEHNITTIIREQGFRLWGNHTCADDEKWRFLSVVRAHDMIFESIEYAHNWAIDRPITKTLLEDVADGVNKYFRYLQRQEAILGGHAYPSALLNTADQITQGKTYIDCEWTPVYPNEHMTFRTLITDKYVEELT